MTSALRIALAIGLLTLTACGPDAREPAPIRTDPTANNGGSDAGDDASNPGDDTGSTPMNNRNNVTPDMDAPDTGMPGDDTGTPGVDTGDLPVGEVCPYTDRPDFVGPCDPVGDTGCRDEGDVCQLVVYLVGNDTRFSSDCLPLPDGEFLSEGEACVGQQAQCSPGLGCINIYDECRPICYADTSAGCDPGEWCRSPSVSWGGLGFCDNTCNL